MPDQLDFCFSFISGENFPDASSKVFIEEHAFGGVEGDVHFFCAFGGEEDGDARGPFAADDFVEAEKEVAFVHDLGVPDEEEVFFGSLPDE